MNLLFGLPLFVGGLIVAAATLLILRLRVGGRDGFPAVVIALLLVLVLSFCYLILRSSFHRRLRLPACCPGWVTRTARCWPRHHRSDRDAARGVPALLAGQRPERSVRSIRTTAMLRFLRRDVIIAMSVAGLVNVAMLLVATSLPAGTGDSLVSVHSAFLQRQGGLFAAMFAVALLASGLASACAGVYSGQAVMQGFLRRSSSIWLRRLVSSVPALAILALVSDPTRALVLSQVVLSFGLPFALIPLLAFTTRPAVMGSFVNRRSTTLVGIVITAVVLGLNGFLLSRLFLAT